VQQISLLADAPTDDQVGFPHAQRQSAEVFAVERENVEGVELHLCIMFA
jgi:hypothetical protein